MQRLRSTTMMFYLLTALILGTGILTANSQDLYLYGAVISSADAGLQDNSGGVLDNTSIRIINLGPVVNYKGVDYAPTISADGKTLFFVSNRQGSTEGEDGEPSHDFWAVKKDNRLDTIFQSPFNIDTTTNLGDRGVNTPKNEGAASIAADRQTLYFTGCNRSDGFGSCDIYRTSIEGDRWGRPVNLGRNVNSKEFDSQPSIAPDQSRVYFISTRKGPNSNGDPKLENADIWYADWDDDLEEWKPAKNLEAINTDGEEASPFIAADNQTLFFASRKHSPNYGGLDFYVTRFDPATNSWSTPENVGRPINTSEDEQFISLPASGDIIYWSSRRDDLKGYQGNLDIFMAFVPTFFRAVNLAGTVIDECSGEFIPAKISVKNPITGRVYDDELTLQRNRFEMIVSNTDYGDPLDSIKFVDLEITAEHPKYGSKTITQRIEKPEVTTKQDEAGSVAQEYEVQIMLGQRPVLSTSIAEAAYISRVKNTKPEVADFNGLVMEQVQTWDLYPLLNYVFFDIGSSEIPGRYKMFNNVSQTQFFTDTTIAGGTMDKYYHLLNIYAYRLKQHPEEKLEIVGTIDGETSLEKNTQDLSKNRAMNVYNYFVNVWNIDENRLKVSWRGKPVVPSSIRVDTTGNQENRRVELISNSWDIMKPVFDKDPKTYPSPETMEFILENGIEDALVRERRIEVTRGNQTWATLREVGTTDKRYEWDWVSEDGDYPKDEVPYSAKLVVTTQSGAECSSEPISIPIMQVTTLEKKVQAQADSTWERYNLILFPFDRSDAGEINERIMKDYVYERVLSSSKVEVIGHTDVVGLYEHNQKLSQRRAGTVETGIKRTTKNQFGILESRGVGEDEPLYNNELPEGRFYNRTVQVIIKTPVDDWENKELGQRSE